jgi:hypothetical protein
MFVRVARREQGLHFTVVDLVNESDSQELELILDLGIIQPAYLNRIQAWYAIAENLLAAEIKDSAKQSIARDLASWLPPLSRQQLIESRKSDLEQLTALGAGNSSITPFIPVELSDDDPLSIIAGWLDAGDPLD